MFLGPKHQPVAVVIPWFGIDLKGGAEQQAWQIATRLAARGHAVEVLTTCCRSFLDDWAQNHLPAGETHSAGVTIRRFPVDPRDRPAFDNLNPELMAIPHSSYLPGVSPVDHDRASIWTQENINSKALEDYLHEHKQGYSAFIFLPYLYGVILRGLPIVAERAWLQPCLHDEAYAYLPDVARIFYQARGLLFISAGEMQVAARLFGPMVHSKGEVAGGGIELDNLAIDHRAYLPISLSDKRFVLCLGRRDAGKGTNYICDAFRAFRRSNPASKINLVLAGPGSGDYNDETSGVVDLGLVSEAQKAALLQHCIALFQPSTNESFSRVLFEAWACGKPVVVHRQCLATAVAVQVSGGGWIAGAQNEWVHHLSQINAFDSTELNRVGDKGREYASEMADWDKALARYERLLGLGRDSTQSVDGIQKLNKIHQLLPKLAYGDPISDQAILIRDWLREAGHPSEIFVSDIDPRVASYGHRLTESAIGEHDELIYHHSIGSEIVLAAVAHPGTKCFVYHNNTPAELFRKFHLDFAESVRQGKEEMWQLAKIFPLSVGDSAYTSEELAMCRFNAPGLLPLAVDPGRWGMPPDETLMRELQDGQNNLLFVGQYAPSKCQHQLIEAYKHYHELDPESRLILVGFCNQHDPYVVHLKQVIDKLGLRGSVILTGHVGDAQLHAYYRTAHLFWSLSEDDGFCAPLIDAMWFDVPVFAFASSAISGALRSAGILIKDKSELPVLAALALNVVSDELLRDFILTQQRTCRSNFSPSAVLPYLQELVKKLGHVATDQQQKDNCLCA